MVLLLALGVCLALPVAVQAQTATLEGRVIDPQDAAIVGATVTVTSPMLRAPVIAISDRTGAYRFASLVPGAYRVTFAIPGFQQQQHDGIVVRAGAVRVLSVQLVLAPLVQRVDVVGVAPCWELVCVETAYRLRCPLSSPVTSRSEERHRCRMR